MGAASAVYPEGHPNAKQYELFYADGSQYVFRQPGREPIREWNLAGAVMMANHVTSYDLELVSVVDPDTRAVVWEGEVSTR